MTNAEKRRRQKEARKERLEAERKAVRTRRQRRLLINLGVLVLAAGGVFFLVRGQQTQTEEVVACDRPAPTRPPEASLEFQAPEEGTLDISKDYVATVQTTCGEFLIDLADEASPNTVSSFVSLANGKFYDGLLFHRIEGPFIQGGDPEGTGSGGPGYQIVEAPPPETLYERGVVGMAKTGQDPPGASGSQFFVVMDSEGAASLNGTLEVPAQYALLGRIRTRQFAVLNEIWKANTVVPEGGGSQVFPDPPIYIDQIRIEES